MQPKNYILLAVAAVGGMIALNSCRDNAGKKEIKRNLEDFSSNEIHLEIMRRSVLFSLSDSLKNKGSADTVKNIMPVAGLENFTNKELLDYYAALLNSQKAIYGKDNRRDITDSIFTATGGTPAFVVALIEKKYLHKNGNGRYRLTPEGRYRDLYSLCGDEKFSEEFVFANCSGFSIAPRLVATAGHCINNSNYSDYYAVFDLTKTNTDNFRQHGIPENLVYEITAFIEGKNSQTEDYAVFAVNKDIPGNRVAKIQKNRRLVNPDKYYVIGFPCGISMKICDDSELRANTHNNFFVISADTYGGNSGSPVFSVTTDSVVGILVRGNEDFKIKASENCYNSVVCPQKGCRGEDVNRVTPLIKHIK